MIMKMILIVLSAIIALQGSTFDNSNTNHLYSPQGNEIEVLLHKQINDTLFIVGSEGEFMALDLATGQRAFFTWHAKMLDPDIIHDFVVLPGMKVYFATEKGLYTYLPNFSGQPSKVRLRLPSGNILVIRAVEGNLLLLYNSRLLATNTKIWKDLGVNLKNSVGAYRDLQVGPDGKIWIRSKKALVRLDGNKKQIYARGRSFRDTPDDVYCTATGQMYALSSRELALYSAAEQKWKRLATSNIPEGNLYVSPTGQIFIYTRSHLYKFQKKKFIRVHMPEFMSDEDLIGIYDNGFNAIYFVTRHSVTTKFYNHEPAILKKTASAQLPYALAAIGINSSANFGVLEKTWLARLPLLGPDEQKQLLDALLTKGCINRKLTDLYFDLYHQTQLHDNHALRQRFISAQFQAEPRLAERIQEDRIKEATDPSALLAEYRNLATLYRLAGQKMQEQALYNEVLQKYKAQNQNYYWLQYRAASMEGDASSRWQGLGNFIKDPLLKILVRQHNFNKYTQSFYNDLPGSALHYQTASADIKIKQLFAVDNGVWILKTNHRVAFWNGEDGARINHPITNKFKALAGSPFGTVALLTNGRLRLLESDGIKKMPVPPPMNSRIEDIWSSGNTLVCKRNRMVFYTEGDNWKQFRLPSAVARFHFIKILPIPNDIWLLVLTNKIYLFDNANGTVQGLQAPEQVLIIYDVLGNVEGGFYAATNAGLYSVFGKTWNLINAEQGFWGRKAVKLSFINTSNTLLALADSTAFLRLNQYWLPFQESKSHFRPLIDQISLAADGTVYAGSGPTIYRWQRGKGDKRLIGLNAARTAGYLERDKRPEQLKKYLHKFTGSAFSGWAYEYLSRVELEIGNPRQGWEMLRIGAKTNSGSMWLSDSTFLSFCWRLLEQNAWDEALKCAQFMNTNFKGSVLKSYLHQIIYSAAQQGNLSNNIMQRLAFLAWLSKQNFKPADGNTIDSDYNILVRIAYDKSNHLNIKPIASAVKKYPSSKYLPYWRYHILNHLANQNLEVAIKGCDVFIKNLHIRSPFVEPMSNLRLKSYLKNLLKSNK